jgi:predicted acyl esterase
MKITTGKVVASSLIIVIVITALFFLCKRQAGREKISCFGKYRGYSEAVYDGYQRRSDYLTLSNGTRLAYDLILPTKKGVPAKGPLPTLFKYTPYNRTFTIFDKEGNNIIAGLFNLSWKEKAYLRVRYWFDKQGHLMDPIFRTQYLKNMIMHGYAVIVVERPGTGASFGVMNASFQGGLKKLTKS